MNEASNFCTGQVCVAPNTTQTAQHSAGEQPESHSTCACVACYGMRHICFLHSCCCV